MAIKPLSADMDNIQKLEIPGLDIDMDVIQKLDDEPNDVGGLSPAELKAEFDKAGNAIKEYINGELLPAISDTVAEAETRAEAEAGRVQAETERVEAEQGRAAAEEARVQAEQQRADENAGIVAQAREQAEAAEESAGEAKTAEQAAYEKAESAEEFAERAEASATAAGADAASAAEDAAAAKHWAELAENIAGGDFPTHQEVEESIDNHNEAQDAHEDIRQEVTGKADKAEGTLDFALGRDAEGVYVVFEEEGTV